MESIIARALEYTLKYWLKSFSRDQFKLQGRTAQLSNLDIDGDALHASMGLPPALNVATARVGKLEIMLPYVSNVQIEPIVVQIDRLDIVLKENPNAEVCQSPRSSPSSASSGKGSGYGFADKIGDGMTLQVQTVNLLLETRGGAHRDGGAAWAAPLASITIRNLLLFTTNESWQVVNLKEARDFSTNTGFIYVFKKLEWEALSIDLLPHPDMFTDASLVCPEEGVNQRDEDGAKRAFFGGERFLEGISGQAYITLQRTELNSPLGLEVQLHIPEALCPALSEPGLRALLRFLTGVYVCLNRGDVDPNSQQQSAEAAGRSLVSIVVDHIFLCIKDAEFQLDLLMQALQFSRACVSDGEKANYLTKVIVGGMFLRDTFSRPPCTLVQPSMRGACEDCFTIPDFGQNFCPPINPLGDQKWQLIQDVPLISLYSLQVKPSPDPPVFATKTVIGCQPLMIHLQEESCLRISSFLADGIVVNPGTISSDSSVSSLLFNLKELDVSVPLEVSKVENSACQGNMTVQNSFAGARLHIENLSFADSPSLKLKLLNLEKDPACFSMWPGQPIDASQKKWHAGASHFGLCLETLAGLTELRTSPYLNSNSWRCVEVKDVSFQVAMVSADGSLLRKVPPPGGIVRIGVSCQQYFSNTSVEQLFFVLDLYTYFGRISEKIAIVRETKRPMIRRHDSLTAQLMDKVPSDTAVNLVLKDLQLRFLESSSANIQGMPLVNFIGKDLFTKVTHRTLGGAIAVSSHICWERVEVDCVDTDGNFAYENGLGTTSTSNGSLVSSNGCDRLRPVLWIHDQKKCQTDGTASLTPFLDISTVHVIPFSEKDRECYSLSVAACISGIRLSGGMSYAEALLHRFGILGADGSPGEGLSRGLENLSSGPLSKLFKPSIISDLREGGNSGNQKDNAFPDLGNPDDVDVAIELKDWLFALEGAEEMAKIWWFCNHGNFYREGRCWHTTFRSLRVRAKSTPSHVRDGTGKSHARQRFPVESIIVGVEGLQTLKPQAGKGSTEGAGLPENLVKESSSRPAGVNVEAHIITSEAFSEEHDNVNWEVENLKFSVKEPIEGIVTRDELQHLAYLCKSEVDSMGRITAGVLRILKLERSVGEAALNQLSNLGTESFDKIFSPRASTSSSPISSSLLMSPSRISETPHAKLEATIFTLEETVAELENKFSALATNLTGSESTADYVDNVKQLTQKLEYMQKLVSRLRTQI